MSVTLMDIAKEVGVTSTTVSAVLRNSRTGIRVAPSTRQRILDVAERLQYSPSLLARGLKGGRTNTVGIIWGLGVPVFAEQMIRALTIRMKNRGYVTNVADNLSEADVTVQLLRDLAHRRVDAIVLQDTTGLANRSEIEKLLRHFAAVVVVSIHDSKSQYDTVVNCPDLAVREIADHLVATGRTSPIFFGDAQHNFHKIRPFREALRSHGVALGDERLVSFEWKTSGALEHGLDALDDGLGRLEIDSMFCENDSVALLAMSHLAKRGIKVPEDIAVVGNDNNPLARFMNPPLASVGRQGDAIATAIEELLFERLGDGEKERQVRTIPMRFIARESAGRASESNDPIHVL